MTQKFNFILCLKPEYVSPTVSLGTVEKNNWTLVMKKDREHLQSIEICRSNGNESFKITCCIRFKYYDEEICNQDFVGYLHEGQLNFFLARGCMTLSGCELSGTVTVCSAPNTDKPTLSVKMAKLGEDYYRLLNNPDSYHDVILKCGKDSIAAHKNILFARSPLFAAMIFNKMTEDCVVNIDDMDVDTLNAMLVYIYSGQTDDLNKDLAEDLLKVAENYKLDELKEICVEKLKGWRSV